MVLENKQKEHEENNHLEEILQKLILPDPLDSSTFPYTSKNGNIKEKTPIGANKATYYLSNYLYKNLDYELQKQLPKILNTIKEELQKNNKIKENNSKTK